MFAILLANGIYAQKPIEVYEDSLFFSNQTMPGATVTIPEVAYESIQKSWVKELESRTKSKAVYENGEWTIFGANIKAASPTPVNIYSKLINQDSLAKLMVAVELKKDVYIKSGSAEAEMTALKNFLKKFARDRYLEVAEDQLNKEQAKLRELEKELSGYKKEESKLGKSIRSNEKTIKEMEEELTSLNNELSSLSNEISTQNSQFDALPEESRGERGKYIKDLEKRQNKLRKNIRSSEKAISKAKKGIESADEDIPEKIALEEQTKEKISAQEEIVRKYEQKVINIKSM